MIRHHGREVSVAMAMAVLAVVLAAAAPSYFSAENLSDLFLANMPVFVVALGATLVILAGEIDISVGSVFAVAGVVAGVVAKLGAPGGVWTTTAAACAVGAIVGAVNGALVAYLQVPSIVVTLRVPTVWASVMHDSVGTPSSCTVQAPQCPSLHAILVPVSPSSSRSTCASDRPTGTSSSKA